MPKRTPNPQRGTKAPSRTMHEDDFERPRPLRPRADDPQELSFEDDDYTRGGRIGDRESDRVIADEYPSRRTAEAGLTGASLPGRDLTADDLSPETLLDEDSATGRFADDPSQRPADQQLRAVDADEIGGGTGLDEAELARLENPDEEQRRESPGGSSLPDRR
jgi:hypothetical protein